MVAWTRVAALGLERSRHIEGKTGRGKFWMEGTGERGSEDDVDVLALTNQMIDIYFPDIGKNGRL